MSGYNVFVVSRNREGEPTLNLMCSVNEIKTAIDFIEKIISRDENYYVNNDLAHESMNRENHYTYVGDRNIYKKAIGNTMFGGFIIEEIKMLESWNETEKEVYLNNPPYYVWMYCFD